MPETPLALTASNTDVTTTEAAGDKVGGRVAALDLLRILAAVAVMMFQFTYRHAVDEGHALSALQLATRHGYLGVELFFMISGFAILSNVRGCSARHFLRSRLLRLYPEFWVSVLIAAVVFFVVPRGHGDQETSEMVLVNLTMFPQVFGTRFVDGVYWTLFITAKFYFLAWGLIALNQTRFLEGWLSAWILLSLAAAMFDLGRVVSSISIMPYGVFFAAGGVFFLVRDSGWSVRRAAMLIACLLLACHIAVSGMQTVISTAHITPAARATTVTLVVLMFAAFSWIASRRAGNQRSALLATLGMLTYPVYLLDDVGKEVFIFGMPGLPAAAKVSLAVAFTVLLAWGVNRVSSRLVQPALSRGLDLVGVR